MRLSFDRRGDELGVERQEAECRALAERLGLTVSKVYRDNDVSATTGKLRPGFEALLRDRPAVVICWHQDRLLRISKDLERVLDAGFTVYQATAEKTPLDLATPTGRAVARTITAWATYEGEHKAERQRAANRQRAAMGLPPAGGPRLFGFEKDGITHHQVEAPLVRKAAEGLLAGSSVRSLARAWNEAGCVTWRGNPWDASSVRRVLQNPRIAGLARYDHAELPGVSTVWEPIVDEAMWRAVQAILADPRRRRVWDQHARYLLTSIALCGRCQSDGILATVGTAHTQHKVRIYKCAERADLARKAADIDAFVTEAVLSRLEHPGFAAALGGGGSADEEPDYAAEAAGIRTSLDELATAFGSGAISLTQLTTASAVLNERLEAAEAAMKGRAGDVLGAFVGRDPHEVWRSLELVQKRAVVRAVTARVVLLPPKMGRQRLDPDSIVIDWR